MQIAKFSHTMGCPLGLGW